MPFLEHKSFVSSLKAQRNNNNINTGNNNKNIAPININKMAK